MSEGTITKSQRISLMQIWGKVCKDRGWKSGDRELRLKVLGQIVGRPLGTTDEIGRLEEFTRVKRGLTALLGESVQAGLEASDPTINEARTIRYHIVTELVPCLELYISDVAGYIAEIAATKNRWWKIDRPGRQIALTDLDAKPIFHVDKADGKVKEFPSQLQQMRYTLTARLNSLRNKAGHSIHDMRTAAGLPCTCSACLKAQERPAALVSAPF